jgi:DNA primase
MNKTRPSRTSRFVDFRSIKDQVSFEQVLTHYGLRDKLSGKGDSLRGCCPIHQGTNPTQFSVSLSKNCWHCHSDCACGGNVLDFVARMEDCNVHSAALKCVEWFRLPMESEPSPPPENPLAAKAPRPSPSPPPQPEDRTPNAPLGFELQNLGTDHPYLAERGLSPETIAEFGLGLCNTGRTIFGRIAIPIRNATGELVAYAGRWPGDPPPDKPKYQFPKGFKKSQELFNLHRALEAPPDQPWIVVEGFFDVIHLWQFGHQRAVALMGSSLSPAQEELIRRHTDQHSQILVMLDEDDAGRSARDEIAARLAKFTFVRIHAFEEEGMQPEHLTAEQLAEVFA